MAPRALGVAPRPYCKSNCPGRAFTASVTAWFKGVFDATLRELLPSGAEISCIGELRRRSRRRVSLSRRHRPPSLRKRIRAAQRYALLRQYDREVTPETERDAEIERANPERDRGRGGRER
jgi:hypothetical protein